MPLAPPISLSLVSSFAGERRSPSRRDRVALQEFDLDVARLVRRLLGRHRPAVDEFLRLMPGIFQRFALGRDVQQVGVDRKRRLAALVLGDGDLVLLGEFEELAAGIEVPLAPGRDHLDVGIERVIAELETDLVVALAGGAMGDGLGPGLMRDLDLALGDERPRDRGAEQVEPLVEGVGAEHREDEVAHELLAQVLDVDLLDPQHLGLAPGGLQLLALAEVGGEGDDFAAIGLLQPFQDDGGVEPAGIGEHDLLDAALHGLPLRVGKSARSIGIGEGGARAGGSRASSGSV